jgi:hypothetical protein
MKGKKMLGLRSKPQIAQFTIRCEQLASTAFACRNVTVLPNANDLTLASKNIGGFVFIVSRRSEALSFPRTIKVL